ncbi:unnamed protein product [Pedinophyceae sp. YPF-701]|nr:unnamed protein product [Pedinophyceae sp. YPF-701]
MDNAVVIDVGSFEIKAGLCANYPCEQEPQLRLKNEVRILENAEDRTVTMASRKALEALPAARPIQRGKICHWDQLEALLDFAIFHGLRWPRGLGGNMLLAHPLSATKDDKERLVQMFFESFGVTGLYVVDAPVLALYAMGKLSGTVVDIGYGAVKIGAVHDGRLQGAGCVTLEGHGMQDVLARLVELLKEHQVPNWERVPRSQLTSLLERALCCMESHEYFQGVKRGELPPSKGVLKKESLADKAEREGREKKAAEEREREREKEKENGAGGEDGKKGDAAENGAADQGDKQDEEKKGSPGKAEKEGGASKKEEVASDFAEYTLTDGTVVRIPKALGAEAVEALFVPQMVGLSGPGLGERVHNSGMLSVGAIERKMIVETVMVCGGGALVPGLVGRLNREIQALAPKSWLAEVVDMPEYMPKSAQQHAVWAGGAVLAKMVFQEPRFITRQDYHDIGPRVVHRRCP